MQKEPPPFIWAIPDEKNILMCMLISLLFLSVPMPYRAICNFELERMLNKCLVPFFIGDYIIVCLKLRLYEAISCQIIQRGPPDSAYAGGEYHGQLIFPSEYPFKPPGIKVRFVIHYDVLTVVSQWRFDIWLIYLDADPVGKISAWQKNLLLDVGFSSGNCKFGWPSRCAYTYLIRLIVESLLERSYNVSMYIPLPHLRHSSSPVLCRFLFEGPLSLHGIFTVRPTCRTSDDTMDFSSVMIHVNSWNSTY